jgi:hypothetical protein
MASHESPQWQLKSMGTSLLGHPVIPPRYGQVDRYKIQAPIRNKKNQIHIFKGFEDQSDTYHDTWTHHLMEQDPLLLQDQAEVIDATATDKVEVLKEENMGPPGPCSSRSGSRYSMSRTCGPRDIISLVIPKVGDNRDHMGAPFHTLGDPLRL